MAKTTVKPKNKCYTVLKYDVRDFNMVCSECDGTTPFKKTRVMTSHVCAHCGKANEITIS